MTTTSHQPDGDQEPPNDEQQPRRFTRGRLSRGKGLRHTTGCMTCRRRRVKCDEVKPACGGCRRKKLECEYRNATQSPNVSREDSTGVNFGDKQSADHDEHGVLETFPSDQEAQGPSTQEPSRKPLTSSESRLLIVSQDPYHDNDLILHNASHTNTAITPLPRQDSSFALPSSQTIFPSDHSHIRQDVVHEVLSPSQLSPYPALIPFGCPADSTNSLYVESPASRWLDLLISDATLTHGPLPDFEFDDNGVDIFGNTTLQTSVASNQSGELAPTGSAINQLSSRARNPTTATRSSYLRERLPCPGDQLREEKKAWQASESIQLQNHERILFRHFVDHISYWMDLFEPSRPFGTLAPHLALRNVGLMNAILALSARHLSLDGYGNPPYAKDYRPSSNDAVGYYYKALHYSQKAMEYDTYKTSLELLAISITISAYEMLDGSSANWQKHLKGVFWIQRSQVIHGDSGGLRQAVWWAWICQDVWAAFREKRKPHTFWRPTRTFEDLNPGEIAARSVHNFAQVLVFCSGEETRKDPSTRAFEADHLLTQLSKWKSYLTLEFGALPMSTPSESNGKAFSPVWVRPTAFAVAMQVYYCSLILVHLHRPLSGGVDEYLSLQQQLQKCSRLVCSIALTLEDYASNIMSSQCVFIAGMAIVGQEQRTAVLELLESSKKRTRWPGNYSLTDDLNRIWQRTDQRSHSP